MIPDHRFIGLPDSFWAYVRLIGQECGYSVRGTGRILVPEREITERKLNAIGILPQSLDVGVPSGGSVWDILLEYFQFRADALNMGVEPLLMNAEEAEGEYRRLFRELNPTCPLPMNKQKGEKKAPAFFTCMINMLIESASGGGQCDYDPRALTTFTKNGTPLRTFARRLDGAFPGVLNPAAVWEIKEYYYTTTFGSRVAGGVYETLLDGMEFEELAKSEGVRPFHYLMVDSHFTWWKCGRSYLCRIVDMLHMGYADEVLFGREIFTRLPDLVQLWEKQIP